MAASPDVLPGASLKGGFRTGKRGPKRPLSVLLIVILYCLESTRCGRCWRVFRAVKLACNRSDTGLVVCSNSSLSHMLRFVSRGAMLRVAYNTAASAPRAVGIRRSADGAHCHSQGGRPGCGDPDLCCAQSIAAVSEHDAVSAGVLVGLGERGDPFLPADRCPSQDGLIKFNSKVGKECTSDSAYF